MKASIERITKELRADHMHLSHQRLKILEYLLKNKDHPSADRIFSSLQPEMSTLSKTTVYNTLKMFADEVIVRVINIDDNEARYDIETEEHGHFMCEACGTVFNFGIDMDCLAASCLDGFKICDRNVYFKGRCPDCETC